MLAVGLLGLSWGTTLLRDAGLATPLTLLLVVGGWFGIFVGAFSWLRSGWTRSVLGIGVAQGILLVCLAFPVMDQLDQVSHASAIVSDGSWSTYLLFNSRVTWVIFYIPIALLLLNRLVCIPAVPIGNSNPLREV